MSHVVQRNIRCSACWSVRSLSETAHLPPQLHLALLFPVYLGSSLSSLHPVPQTQIRFSTGPLHMPYPLPGSVLVMFLIIPSSGKHSPSRWLKPPITYSWRLYPSSQLLLLSFYVYLVTIWWTLSPMRLLALQHRDCACVCSPSYRQHLTWQALSNCLSAK